MILGLIGMVLIVAGIIGYYFLCKKVSLQIVNNLPEEDEERKRIYFDVMFLGKEFNNWRFFIHYILIFAGMFLFISFSLVPETVFALGIPFLLVIVLILMYFVYIFLYKIDKTIRRVSWRRDQFIKISIGNIVLLYNLPITMFLTVEVWRQFTMRGITLGVHIALQFSIIVAVFF